MERTPLKIGTRNGELALRQTELALDALRRHTLGLDATIRTISTAGDRRTDLPLNEVNRATGTEDKGVFIAALEEALAKGEIDCAVHSLKDMPGTLDERFEIAAVLPRESIWDALILKAGVDKEHLTIGTSSVRRAQLIRSYWSGSARAISIRGNVTTRLQKLVRTSELDGLILARAGLNRLGYTGDTLEVDGTLLHVVDLSRDSFMPALCQGAIAIEIRKGDTTAQALIAPLNDPTTSLCIRAERAFLAALKADCSVPVCGYATCTDDFMMFRAIYFTPEGTPHRITLRGSASDPEAIGQKAFEQLQQHLA